MFYYFEYFYFAIETVCQPRILGFRILGWKIISLEP